MQTHAPCSAWAAISDDAYDTVNSEIQIRHHAG